MYLWFSIAIVSVKNTIAIFFFFFLLLEDSEEDFYEQYQLTFIQVYLGRPLFRQSLIYHQIFKDSHFIASPELGIDRYR